VLHNAGFATIGLDWAYLAFEVPAGRGSDAVRAVGALGLLGLSVTMPHKADAAATVDVRSPTAERLGVVNTVVRRGGELFGDSTDGEGFVDALRADKGFEPDGKRCVIVGAGGAARSVVLALADAGAAAVVVVGRTPSRAEETAALAGAVGRVGVVADGRDADLIVNATPIGMHGVIGIGSETMPFDPDLVGPGQLVADLIYAPAVTPLLAAAAERGAATVNGLGMLVHQAGRQFTLWTGQPAPLEAMSAAALAAIAGHP
jgi:shikimate dehydrogenase